MYGVIYPFVFSGGKDDGETSFGGRDIGMSVKRDCGLNRL